VVKHRIADAKVIEQNRLDFVSERGRGRNSCSPASSAPWISWSLVP